MSFARWTVTVSHRSCDDGTPRSIHDWRAVDSLGCRGLNEKLVQLYELVLRTAPRPRAAGRARGVGNGTNRLWKTINVADRKFLHASPSRERRGECTGFLTLGARVHLGVFGSIHGAGDPPARPRPLPSAPSAPSTQPHPSPFLLPCPHPAPSRVRSLICPTARHQVIKAASCRTASC